MKEDKELLRITTLGILVAIFFGIITYFKDKPFEYVGIEVFLSVSSKVFFSICLPIFILYLCFVGYSLLTYFQEENLLRHFKNFFFDFGICLIFVILFMTASFLVLIKLLEVSIFNNKFFIWFFLILMFSGGGFLLKKGIDPYLKKLSQFRLKKKIKINWTNLLLGLLIVIQLITNYFLLF